MQVVMEADSKNQHAIWMKLGTDNYVLFFHEPIAIAEGIEGIAKKKCHFYINEEFLNSEKMSDLGGAEVLQRWKVAIMAWRYNIQQPLPSREMKRRFAMLMACIYDAEIK